MFNAVLEISHAVGIGVPRRYIVVACFSKGAVERWKVVFADVRVVAPAAELVPVVQRNREFNVWRKTSYQ